MSDIQAELPLAPLTPPAPGLENETHTEAGLIAPAPEAPPVGQEAPAPVLDAPAAVVAASVAINASSGPLDHEFIRTELNEILFGLKSGVTNGVDAVKSLIQHIESKM